MHTLSKARLAPLDGKAAEVTDANGAVSAATAALDSQKYKYGQAHMWRKHVLPQLQLELKTTNVTEIRSALALAIGHSPSERHAGRWAF